MAKIGSYAGLAFEVTDKKVLTFDEFSRETSPRWDTHEIQSNKPLLEFRGPGLDEITFTIKLRADLGVNPKKQIEKLRNFANSGKTSLFVLGSKAISSNHWVIDTLRETVQKVDNKGNILSIEAELTLKEYMKLPKPKKATVKAAKNKTTTKKSSLKKTGTITITVKSVHIRSGPGVKYKVLGYAFRNKKLTVYGKKNGWYYLGSGKYITGSTKYSKFKKG